jgi:hypothetical protein
MRFILILVVVLLLLPASARAQDESQVVTLLGRELYDICVAVDDVSRQACDHYVGGVHDGIGAVFAAVAVASGAGAVPRAYCPPASTTVKEMTEHAVRYLEDHQQWGHLSAAVLVYGALSRAYPCLN